MAPARKSCRDLATRLTTHKPVGIVELVSRTVVDRLPQDALLLPPAPPPGLCPGTRHQVQSPKIRLNNGTCTDKKENQIFLIYKEIQMGLGAKSNMRKVFLLYDEMRKFFPIYVEVVSHMTYVTLHPIPLNFLIYEENFLFSFYQCIFA